MVIVSECFIPCAILLCVLVNGRKKCTIYRLYRHYGGEVGVAQLQNIFYYFKNKKKENFPKISALLPSGVVILITIEMGFS